jgi:diguanylate cyclase (GGDEF)-like protein
MSDRLDPRTEAARRAALFYLVGGLLAVSLGLGLAEAGAQRTAFVLLGSLDLLIAALLHVLPWRRWPVAALYALIPPTLAVIVLFELFGREPPEVYFAFFMVVGIWIGLSLPRFAALKVSPLLFVAYLAPALIRGEGHGALLAALTDIPLCVVTAEVIARVVADLEGARGEAERRARILHAITLASRDISRLSSAEVIARVFDSVRMLGFEAAALTVAEPERGVFRIAHCFGFPEEFTQGVYPLQDGVTGQVWREAQTVVVANYRAYPAAVPALRDSGFDFLIAAPATPVPPPRSVLIAGHRRHYRLTDELRDAFELLAAHAGIALENARQFEQEQDRARAFRESALRDALTGLGNRRHADAVLANLQPADGVVMLDLDRFKEVNDRDGHAAGDALLRELGEFLRLSLRPQDLAARYGGEEFVLVIPAIGAGLGHVVERLLAAWRARTPRTTLSAGFALHRSGDSPQETLRRADAALYQAKRSGRDRACGESAAW